MLTIRATLALNVSGDNTQKMFKTAKENAKQTSMLSDRNLIMLTYDLF